METQTRSRVAREEWAKRVERWRDSGLKCAEFAAEVGINPRTLTYWKWVLGKEARGEKRAWPSQKPPQTSTADGRDRRVHEHRDSRVRGSSSGAAGRALRARSRCRAVSARAGELRRGGAAPPPRSAGGVVIPAAVRIFVSTEPVDMRQGFDRLAQAVRAKLGEHPQSGSLFVFANRGATRLKVLWFDSNGYCLLYKRLHRAVFELPPSGGAAAVQIDARRLAELLRGAARVRSRKSDVRNAAAA
jgi:transposase